MHVEQTADSETISTFQVSSVQLVTDKSLEALNKASGPSLGPTTLVF